MQKIIDSGISIQHARNWKPEEAIREVLQNTIDVKFEFYSNISVTWENGVASIQDDGPGLKMEHFAFGHNNKAEGSIGQFGEGLKSAFVTLIRLGRIIELRSRDMTVTPFLQKSENFGVETLHYLIDKPKTLQSGTNVILECTDLELEIAQTYFVEFGQTFGLGWFEAEKISRPANFIYVNGSRVASLSDALFSYHLTGHDAQEAVNRDRNTVDMEKIEPLIINTIKNTSSRQVMKTILTDIVEISNHYEAGLRLKIYDGQNITAWKSVWDSLYDDKNVIPSEWKIDNKATYLGFNVLRNLDYAQQMFLGSIGVKSSVDVVKEYQSTESDYALEDLTEEERINLEWVIDTLTKHYHNPEPIFVSELAKGISGTYNVETREIRVAREVLPRKSVLLDTVLHETVHKVSGFSDCTEGFQDALCIVAVRIILRIEGLPFYDG